eukprot:1122083-Amphidinium_carterae.1
MELSHLTSVLRSEAASEEEVQSHASSNAWLPVQTVECDAMSPPLETWADALEAESRADVIEASLSGSTSLQAQVQSIELALQSKVDRDEAMTVLENVKIEQEQAAQQHAHLVAVLVTARLDAKAAGIAEQLSALQDQVQVLQVQLAGWQDQRFQEQLRMNDAQGNEAEHTDASLTVTNDTTSRTGEQACMAPQDGRIGDLEHKLKAMEARVLSMECNAPEQLKEHSEVVIRHLDEIVKCSSEAQKAKLEEHLTVHRIVVDEGRTLFEKLGDMLTQVENRVWILEARLEV